MIASELLCVVIEAASGHWRRLFVGDEAQARRVARDLSRGNRQPILVVREIDNEEMARFENGAEVEG